MFYANDSNNDGWLSTRELFDYAKNFTENTLPDQNPENYYSTIDGDLPLLQINATSTFPNWDIAIKSIYLETDYFRIEPERLLTVCLSLKNEGKKIASFDVSIYLNSSLFLIENMVLYPSEFKSVNFSSNIPEGFYGRFQIKAVLSVCPGEKDQSDNVCVGLRIKIVLIGDLNIDANVDIDDICTASESFGSNPAHPRWNSDADINLDKYVGIEDMILIASNFGKTYYHD
jgi:hypothetical protein